MTLFIFILSLLIQKPNFCSCIRLGPIDDEQYNEYALIAKGKVVKVSESRLGRTISLAVDSYYKGGKNKDTLKIISPLEEGSCGIFPKVGENWLMFAYSTSNNYKTYLCTRTKKINSDGMSADLKFLEAKRQAISR